MCLGMPGRILSFIDPEHGIAKVDVGGVDRKVNVQLLQDGPDRVDVGDWVLVHVGFAMQKIDEAEAQATFEFLESLGQLGAHDVEEAAPDGAD